MILVWSDPFVILQLNKILGIAGAQIGLCSGILISRMYRLFAMETILATAFGREVNIQRGESDGLTKTAYTITHLMTEGQLTSREILYLIFSESFN